MHIQSSSSSFSLVQSLAALGQTPPAAAAVPVSTIAPELIQNIQRWAQLDPARAQTAQLLTTHLQTRPNAPNLSLFNLSSPDLPPELAHLQQLRRLHVSLAQPQPGAPPLAPVPAGTWDVIGGLTQLRDLELLTDTLPAPDWLTPANFPHLTALGVQSGSLAPNGNLAQVLREFPDLHELTVIGALNEAAGSLEGIAAVGELRQLNLRGVAIDALPACLTSSNFPRLHLVCLEDTTFTEVPARLINLDAHVALVNLRIADPALELALHQRTQARLAGTVSGGLQWMTRSPAWSETTHIRAVWDQLTELPRADERLSAGIPASLESLMWFVNWHREQLSRGLDPQPARAVPLSSDTQRSAIAARSLIDTLRDYETAAPALRTDLFGIRFEDQYRVLQRLVEQLSDAELTDIATVFGADWRAWTPPSIDSWAMSAADARAISESAHQGHLLRTSQNFYDGAIDNGHPPSAQLQEMFQQLAASVTRDIVEGEISLWSRWPLPQLAALRATSAANVAAPPPLDEAALRALLFMTISPPPAQQPVAGANGPLMLQPAPLPPEAPPLADLVRIWRRAPVEPESSWTGWINSICCSLAGPSQPNEASGLGSERSNALAAPSPWSSIADEPNADTFALFLTDLTETAEYQLPTGRDILRGRVGELLEDIEASTARGEIGRAFRGTCFSITGLNPSCGDRVTETMNQLDLARLDYHASAGDLTPEQLLSAGRSAFRAETLRVVSNHAIDRLRQMPRVPGDPQVDEIEVHLAFQMALAPILGLPFRARDMLYMRESRLTPQDLVDGGMWVLDQEKANHGEALTNFLAQWTPWQHHMERTHPDVFAPLQAAREARMEALQAAIESVDESNDESADKKSPVRFDVAPEEPPMGLTSLNSAQENDGDEKSQVRSFDGPEQGGALLPLNSGQYTSGIAASEAQYRNEYAAAMTRLTAAARTQQIASGQPAHPLFADAV